MGEDTPCSGFGWILFKGLVGCLHGRREVRMGDGEEEGRGVFEGEARGGEETRQCRAQEASHCRGCCAGRSTGRCSVSYMRNGSDK